MTDANGCFKETSNITLTQPDTGLSISTNSTSNISCNGADDGSIDITISGGTAISTDVNQYIGYARDNDSDGSIFKTIDGGQTWTKVNNIAYNSLEFPSENVVTPVQNT